MVRRIRITRHGLTACPSCHAHIRVADNLAETVCPFCSAGLADAFPHLKSRQLSRLARVAQAGRSGILAASLLGLTGMGACGDDNNVQPAYGVPADTIMPDTAQDATPQPEYGMPADIKISDTTPGQDAGPQPAYGEPADVIGDTAPDAGPQPEYGMPGDV